EHLAPAGQHVAGGAGHGVHVPGAALTAEQGDPGAQFPVRVEVDAVLLVEGHVDHAVVWGDVEPAALGELFGQTLNEAVDVHELAAPGVGVHAEAVAGAVDVGVVRVDQGAAGGGELSGRQVHALLAGQPPVEGAAAERDLRQRRVDEGRGGDLCGM